MLKRNSVRLAQVWMDEYAKYYYMRVGNDLVIDFSKSKNKVLDYDERFLSKISNVVSSALVGCLGTIKYPVIACRVSTKRSDFRVILVMFLQGRLYEGIWDASPLNGIWTTFSQSYSYLATQLLQAR